MSLIKTLIAWCRAALSARRRARGPVAGYDDADLAQRVRLSGEW